MKFRIFHSAVALLASLFAAVSSCAADDLERVRVSDDGRRFVLADSAEPFVVWGVNYDHDADGRLIEDYWETEWQTIVDDFQEIKSLNANVVRIHLQLGRFMESQDTPDAANLERLSNLLTLAKDTGLYLNLTGLGCYHKQDVPEWYDVLSESDRWKVQERFWTAVAAVCRDSQAVFCYDLMNEPVLAGQQNDNEWLAGEFGGKHFVQRITLDLAGRSREEVARQWVSRLTTAIRSVDDRHLITVGVIPWAHVFPKAKPLFYSEEAGQPLDFVSVHFYPKAGEVERSLTALQVYEVGKPLVVEEIFPLKCSIDEAAEFIDGSRPFCDGWMSFYWGATIEENLAAETLQGAVIAKWLDWFRSHQPDNAGAAAN